MRAGFPRVSSSGGIRMKALWCGVLGVVSLALVLTLPTPAHGQEATLSGTVADTSGLVLPGVTITAVHPASGNTYVAVTDQAGAFRVPVRTGGYQVSADLDGFGTVTRKVDLLVGQTAVLTLAMAPKAIEEAIIVTGEAPLLDTTDSAIGANVDPRQMTELPLNGRNFVDLTMLAPGSRQNAITNDEPGNGLGSFQLNVDG